MRNAFRACHTPPDKKKHAPLGPKHKKTGSAYYLFHFFESDGWHGYNLQWTSLIDSLIPGAFQVPELMCWLCF